MRTNRISNQCFDGQHTYIHRLLKSDFAGLNCKLQVAVDWNDYNEDVDVDINGVDWVHLVRQPSQQHVHDPFFFFLSSSSFSSSKHETRLYTKTRQRDQSNVSMHALIVQFISSSFLSSRSNWLLAETLKIPITTQITNKFCQCFW